jgi:hypothetical protein
VNLNDVVTPPIVVLGHEFAGEITERRKSIGFAELITGKATVILDSI